MRREPLILGVLNVTPDSFSDGGRFLSPDAAVQQGAELWKQGADYIDVGGESTRPGADAVPLDEEIARTVPVVQRLVDEVGAAVSIDTYKYEVAVLCVEAGATVINDVSGGSDPRMATLAAERGVSVILMHRKGDARTMQNHPHYPSGVVQEVLEFLRGRSRAFEEAGVARDNIWVDPGIGFGKTLEHNLQLLRHLEEFQGIGGRVAIGTSRKSFLSMILENPQASMERRAPGTLASNLWAYQKGASVFRVHDVAALRDALSTWEAIDVG